MNNKLRKYFQKITKNYQTIYKEFVNNLKKLRKYFENIEKN